MKWSALFLSLTFFVIFQSSATADVWVPPWGEAVYDSIQINIQVGEAETSVGITTRMGVRKLVSDDYLLDYMRGTRIGNLIEEHAIAEVSDQLNDFEADGDLITFTYLSTLAQEDELSLAVSSRYTYVHENPADMLSELLFSQAFHRTSEDSAWEFIDIMPVYEGGDFHVSITSNVEISAYSWSIENREWGDRQRGRELSIDGSMSDVYDMLSYNLTSPLKIEFDNDGEAVDSLFEDIQYELAPEMRERVPDLIIDENVRISLSSYPAYPDNDVYEYYMIADINLDPELADAISPMWLWFPNDQTHSPEVNLDGLFVHGAWGHFPEYHRDLQLEVRQGRVDGQDGFYIKFPSLANQVITPNDIWFWSETSIHVEVSQEWQGNSARFILITAPLEYSTIRFTIPDWKYFNTWGNPLEEVDIEHRRVGNVLTFSGFCPEPGIAFVTWGNEDTPSAGSQLPKEFSLNEIYPNPFNSTATISYSLPVASQVSLRVFDLSGREVKSLVEGNVEAGNHTVSISGEGMASGVYLVRLEASGHEFTSKIMLVR